MAGPGRPSKPLSLVQGHRTKAEKAVRSNGEAALLTGEAMKEWPSTKDNPVAHKHFVRLRKLLQAIGKNDALTESVINRYAVLLAEAASFEAMARRLNLMAYDMDNRKDDMEFAEWISRVTELGKQILETDRAIQTKRKMLLDIEKENVMTIASALRSIPKKAEEKAPSRMAQMIKGGS